MYDGIRKAGDRAFLLREQDYREPDHDVAVFYGYTQTLRRVMADYVKAGRPAVYIDLGYWCREGMQGYHKISVNNRHPTAYFQARKHGRDRADQCRVMIQDWRGDGEHILLAGMGDKAADAEGFTIEEFERKAIAQLRSVTNRKIIYRPKPSWTQAKPLEGCEYSPKAQPLADVLRNCHAIVCHHSNVAVDAIVSGIPAFCWKGVAMPLAQQDLTKIETPRREGDRRQWVNDIAYVQWSVPEMHMGLPWRNMKNEGLIP
jgi:hypothetical protein